MSVFDDEALKCKVIITGPSGSGKTSILNRYVSGIFNEYVHSSTGIDFYTKVVEVDDGYVSSSPRNSDAPSPRSGAAATKSPSGLIKLNIWDTAGQERYQAIVDAYYRGALGALLVFDLTDIKAFHRLATYIDKLVTLADEDIIIFLVGNKNDLEDKRAVPLNTAMELAKDNSRFIKDYIETSAKSGSNIDQMFTMLGQACFNNLRFRQMASESMQQQTTTMSPQQQNQQNLRVSGVQAGAVVPGTIVLYLWYVHRKIRVYVL